jgi:isoleucyl-tRNA synthetase
MFKAVTSQVSYPKLEEEVLEFWKAHDTFNQSMKLREQNERYVFFEGPPTANGRPGLHHVLARVFKDLLPRYQTMKGKYVQRKGGWDTHGLPVELEVEKKIGSKSKQDIERFGIAEFNKLCRRSVWEYVQEWERMTDRIGFWVGTDNAYITYDNAYIETGWWILKSLWERGLLFKDYKVTMHCPRCSTSLADHEVSLGFRDNVEDPSVYVKFRVAEGALVGSHLVAWTTTPWTLPANVALALKSDADYVLALHNGELYVLAAARMHDVLGDDALVVETVRGEALVGARYENVFTGYPAKGDAPDMKNAYRVISDENVSLDDGTGIVHIAPAYGDLEVGRRHALPTLFSVDLNGHLLNEFGPELGGGKWFKDADKDLARDLRRRGLLLKEGRVHHSYPFCWRCDSPLLYYAKTSWYIRTTAVKERLLSANKEINWVPAHVQQGRFGNWLENNVDWALSRERYWGTPLPIWQCSTCGHYDCIGSVEEMRTRALDSDRTNWSELDLHRPWVDAVLLRCNQCGGTMQRLPEVLDCWFDSGAMPYAQWHYPFENSDKFEDQFPADFICEAIDQTRGWFYSLHALGVLLKDSPAYKNVMVLGHVQDASGKKMSKSLGNTIDPWHILNNYGADALRWYLYRSTSLGNPYRFNEVTLGREVVSGLFNTLWNTYSFFVTYANIDDWKPPTGAAQKRVAAALAPLDRWVLSELQVLVREVDTALTAYDVVGAVRRIELFVGNLSNWYVRRSRRRFWKTRADADKQAAYAALYECLVTLAKLMAPFTPFLSEAMFQNLVRSTNVDAPESVHHCDFPSVDEARIDDALMRDTRLVMRLASLGLAARKQSSLKVRQPLAEAVVALPDEAEREAMRSLVDQLAEEWNVKSVQFVTGIAGIAELWLNPLPAKLGPKLGEAFQKVRQALMGNPQKYGPRLQQGETVRVEIDGHSYEITAQEVEVRLAGREGWAVASDSDYAVALSTTLTDTLKREGLARELVRQYNDLRKTAGLRVEDQMRATWAGPDMWAQVITEHGDYIRQETLAAELTRSEAVPDGAHGETVTVEGSTITVSVRATSATKAKRPPSESITPTKKARPKKKAEQVLNKEAVTRKPFKSAPAKKVVPRKAVRRVLKRKTPTKKPTGKTTPRL